MRDPEDLWTREVDLGLINQNGTKKPVYDSLKKYWQSIFVNGLGKTDEKGQVAFNAIPGIFDVTVAGKTVSVHLHPENSVFVQEKGVMIVPLNGEMTSAPPPSDETAPIETPMADDSLSPCDLSKDMIGLDVTVTGQVYFVDQGDDGTFFELEDQDCRVGAFVMKPEWNQWPQDLRDLIKVGNSVQVLGRVNEFQGNVELELLEPPFFSE